MHIMFKSYLDVKRSLLPLLLPVSLKFYSQIRVLFRDERQHSEDIAPLFIGVVLILYFWCFRPL